MNNVFVEDELIDFDSLIDDSENEKDDSELASVLDVLHSSKLPSDNSDLSNGDDHIGQRSNVILDIKPEDEETDMKILEEQIRSINRKKV